MCFAVDIDGLTHKMRNSSALVMELRLFHFDPSKYNHTFLGQTKQECILG